MVAVAATWTAPARVALALRRNPVCTVTFIGDTCVHLYLISKLGSTVDWLGQRGPKCTPSDRTAAFEDKCEHRMGHPSDLGADKEMGMPS